jgi:hypothetical protein
MNRRTFASLALVLACTMFAARPARAEEAAPPVGSWLGVFPDGSALALVLQRDGSCMYGPVGAPPVVGQASWQATTPVGGILTIHYTQAGFRNRAYYSITWVDRNTVWLSDPYFKVTMKRQ